MAFVAALQKLFKDYETLLNAYNKPSKKNATEKTLDETLVSVTEETKKAAEVELQPARVAAEVELQPAKVAAEVESQPAKAGGAVKAKDFDEKQISTIQVKQGPTKIKIQPTALFNDKQDIPTKKPSNKDAIDNMKSLLPDLTLKVPLDFALNVNNYYGAPQAARPLSPLNSSSYQDIMESIKIQRSKTYKARRQMQSIFFNEKTQKYEPGFSKKQYQKAIKFLKKEEELKKLSKLDFETQKYLQDKKIKKALGIKSCCSKSEMSDQLYDGIPIKICEKKENLKTYPDSFFNCFVDFFNCIGFSISEKKLRTLVSTAIEKYSFSEEELNELYMEVNVNIELLGKSMYLEQKRMRELLDGPNLLKYKLSNAIKENFVQFGSAIYPFMNKVLENLKITDFSNKTSLVGDFDDSEVLSDNDWLKNSTTEDFSFTIGGKMYSNLEFVVIVGYKQSKINKNNKLETTIHYVLENNWSSESNDRLVLIQSYGFLYDLCFVESDGERVFIMDKTKIFAKTSEKLIKEEKLVRKEKEKQLEVVNEKIELLDNNKQKNINEIKNINNQNILLNTAISNNYNRNYYKKTKNCDTLTIVGFMAKILNNVLQEIEETATDDDTIDSLEIKFLAIMNKKISKKRSAKYDCRIENINDEYILITKETGINTPRVKKHKTSLPTNPQPQSTTTNLVFNGFEIKVLAKIKDFWRRNTQSLDKNIIENKKRILNLENSISDINNEKNKLIKDKGVIEKELSVLKKSLEEKIDQLQETKSSPAVNTMTPVPQLPKKEKVADVPMSVELKKQFELEKELGVQQDLSNVTRFAQPHVYMPGMFGKKSSPPPPPPPPQGKGVYIPSPPPPPPPPSQLFKKNPARQTLSLGLMEEIEKSRGVVRVPPSDKGRKYNPQVILTPMQKSIRKRNKNAEKERKAKELANLNEWIENTPEQQQLDEAIIEAKKAESTRIKEEAEKKRQEEEKKNNLSPEEIQELERLALLKAAEQKEVERLARLKAEEQNKLRSMKMQEALASIRNDIDPDTDKEDDVWDCAYQRFCGGRTNRALSRGTF